ncbi:hypothetical protein [Arthrobacter sp. NEB 688]|uniref:hypothetical protein n=1 Tax=Arthrobacter sp. NEB 688 TaxID=904039 RepID=UPI001565EB17|nr:hypothetical protein [Arthrobacter sp. NEB 688]QKE85567.1 hypothetical protein HL663_17650 [Arthrobacter sp. NEB 688]
MDADDPRSPFLATDAAAMGISRRALHGGRYRPVVRAVFIDARVPDTVVVRSRAALLVAPDGAVLSHWTAARLWGGRVPENDSVHVSFSRRVRWRLRGVKPHCYIHRLATARRHGLPVTTPAATFCLLAAFLGLVDLVALGDSLVRRGHITPHDLCASAEGWVGQHRAEAIEAARLVRDGVDSSPETTLRLLMVLSGLPEPRINVTVYRDDGSIRYRIELAYEEQRAAIEYDGRWHEEPAQRVRDSSRREGLAAQERWTFVVVTPDELFSATEDLVDRLHSELRALGVPVPPRPDDAWRQYFRVARIAA